MFDQTEPQMLPETAIERTPATQENACPICKKQHSGSMSSVLRALGSHVDDLKKKLRGLGEKDYDLSYGKGKWSIRQVLCHLRDCEINFAMRWRKMISEENAAILPFDQNLWSEGTRYRRQDAKAAFSTWQALRESNVEMLKLAGKAAWSRSGLHPEYGPVGAEQLARHVVYHDLNHFGHIELARARARKGKRA